MHSDKYEIVKSYYEMYVNSGGKRGWSVAKVRNAVAKGWITEEEFEEITGEPYGE
ncbi:MAG: XkdX family protein [Lachnospiraceae bacterium]|nr:XkdX family protein [Lachnospiraceae bacterium]